MTTTKPRAPEKAASDDQAETPPEESKAARTARLRAELAELERNDAGVIPPEPTHILVLANGETVETSSPGATHHAVIEGGPAYPVISRFELQRGEV